MMVSSHNELIFSFRELEQFKSLLNSKTQAIFNCQWERILKKLADKGFYDLSLSQSAIDEMQFAHFWHCLVSEILNTGCSLGRLNDEAGAEGNLLYSFRWGAKSIAKIPFAIADRLLMLHAVICPELLQKTVSVQEQTQ